MSEETWEEKSLRLEREMDERIAALTKRVKLLTVLREQSSHACERAMADFRTLQAHSSETEGQLRKRVAELESQLAWKPVSKGLPTEPGEGESYEFYGWGHIHRLTLNGESWESSDGDFLRVYEIVDDYTHYRRIELPKGGES